MRRVQSSIRLLPLAAAAAFLLSGCHSGTQQQPADQTQQANQAATQPATQPAPAAPAASAPAAAAAPAPQRTESRAAVAPAPPPREAMRAPEPVVRTLPAGKTVAVRVRDSLSSKTSDVGQPFSGSLAGPLTVNGATIFPTGTPVAGVVASSKGQGRFKGEGVIGIQLTRIGDTAVQTSEFQQVVKGKGKRTATMAGGGAGLGAIIGGIAGGGKGALIGGLAGAGAGTAGTAFTGNKAAEIPAESVVTFRLASPVTVTLRNRGERDREGMDSSQP